MKLKKTKKQRKKERLEKHLPIVEAHLRSRAKKSSSKYTIYATVEGVSEDTGLTKKHVKACFMKLNQLGIMGQPENYRGWDSWRPTTYKIHLPTGGEIAVQPVKFDPREKGSSNPPWLKSKKYESPKVFKFDGFEIVVQPLFGLHKKRYVLTYRRDSVTLSWEDRIKGRVNKKKAKKAFNLNKNNLLMRAFEDAG